jgi:hypothetical protein
MTKKDYEVFAKMFGKMLANEPDDEKYMQIWEFIDKTCELFKADNPKFKKETFEKAINLQRMLGNK